MQLEERGLYDGASKLSSKIKQTLSFPFTCVTSKRSKLQKGRRRFGGDLNTFKGLSLTASVLPVHRPQGCSPL